MTGSLTELLTDESRKNAVVEDCLEVLDAEVADKRGMSGMAIKAGFKAVKGIRPGFLRQVVVDLLPEFAKALDPLYQEARSEDKPVGGHIRDNADRAAEALLAITDRKAERAKKGLVLSTYKRLRGQAKKNVVEAMPRVGAMIERHAKS